MWITLLLIASIIGYSQSLPAPVPSLHYETGITYKYSYQFTVLLNEDSNLTSRAASIGRNVGYQVSSEFLLSSIWESPENSNEKLIKLELLKPTLLVSSNMQSTEGDPHWSKLDNLSYPPIYIHWNDGNVKKVYVLPDSQDMINIKKGIASLLQLRMSDAQVKEADVAGLCDVRYKVHGTTIKKRKTNCERNYFHQNNLGAKQLLRPTLTASSDMIIELNPQESVIQSIKGREEVRMTLNLWKQAAVYVKSKIHLNFVEHYGKHAILKGKNVGVVLNFIAEEMGSKLKGETLEASLNGDFCPNCMPVSQLTTEFGSNLLPDYLGELKSAGGFLKFLESVRRASKKEILMMFKDSNGPILTQILDVLAAAQSNDALDVAFELIDFESKDIGIAERFLLCLATTPNPSETTIAKTMKLLNKNFKNVKLKASLMITLSSLVRTYCTSNATNVNALIVQNVNQILVRGLQGCQDAACIINHLLALRNIALPQNLPLLVEFVKKGGILGLMALEAMKDIGEQHFTQEINQVLFRVYNQFWPHQESAARVLAAELLMKSSPTAETIGEIIASLPNDDQSEIVTLVVKKLYTSMQESAAVRSCVMDLLKNSTFGNYYNLAHNGSSSSVINELQATHDANITYGINVEMRQTGMLKRTSFDLNLLGNGENTHLMSMSLFVEGFGLTDEELKENPQEHSAGMQLSVLGVHLRPYIFFTGTGELMSLIWSGAGNNPTPAVQGNFLIIDQTHSVVLQNGINVDLNLKGALSTDVSGSVEVSMWNKNAHAVVKNKGALLVNGFCRVDTSFVESHVDFAMGGNSVLDMVVDLDFAQKPMAICLQMEQPSYSFRHNVRKTETIPGSKLLIKTLKRRTMYFPGKSFNLVKSNSDSCRAMLQPKKHKSFW
ncbi:microsomal triglyceride transfer protein large subunit-like isoform X1 [Argiope bruennichi]|uniref:microsomal triglyceride transfer protein large subunit-like isoform X1 n=1 Tax=Argiope bruennichi TaxID=94029 RepID=UPI0024957609|nr:microsomal triglyceride transfer protein large subunit-like isoform X1 [Argiope bruennichi]